MAYIPKKPDLTHHFGQLRVSAWKQEHAEKGEWWLFKISRRYKTRNGKFRYSNRYTQFDFANLKRILDEFREVLIEYPEQSHVNQSDIEYPANDLDTLPSSSDPNIIEPLPDDDGTEIIP